MPASRIEDGYTLTDTFTGVDGKEYAVEYRPMLGAKRSRLFGATINLAQFGWKGVCLAADATVSAMTEHIVSLSENGTPLTIDEKSIGDLPPDVFEKVEKLVTGMALPSAKDPPQSEQDEKN